MDDDGDVLAARPLALDEQRPQVRVLRRTVEQIGDVVPLVPALADSVPQVVDQLVEAPTIVSLIDVIRQPVEQPVDIPVRALGGTGGRLQFFLPGQFSSFVEQIADIPVPHGGLHLQDPGLASLPHEVAGEAFQGVFSTFHRRKKSAKIGPHSGSELLPESSPSTRAAHSDQFWEDEFGGTWMLMPSGRWYLLCSDPEVFWDGPG